jgi:hypothetical protein
LLEVLVEVRIEQQEVAQVVFYQVVDILSDQILL